MIIGNGLLAKAFSAEFAPDTGAIVFASGVSNSRETRPEAFERERTLLEQALGQEKRLMYFSTCSIQDPDLAGSAYVRHKLAMEELIRQRAPKYAIFRLPQVVGHTPNPHTLTNYLHHIIESGDVFHVWTRARRNLIDVDDVVGIAHQLLVRGDAENRILNIACPFSIPVIELVKVFENVMGRKANYDLVEAGGSYAIDVTEAMQAAKEAGIVIDAGYIDKLIRKYYEPAR
ncbi:NAD-dependent epimerase/dehydratase family protein [Massilia sp. SM-13]|uniref:NAD-dependent epimerase/dehydratase family protein n=1 Tax=Pseudoduganella rhizocola TaxID=3382643 RepID=UPI0038B4D3BE